LKGEIRGARSAMKLGEISSYKMGRMLGRGELIQLESRYGNGWL
jgi:hypothetical protein